MVIIGDFKIDFSNKTENRDVLIDLFQFLNLNMTTVQPSYITSTSEICIDKIFTNLGEAEYDIKTLDFHIADNMAQLVAYRVHTKSSEMKPCNPARRIVLYMPIVEPTLSYASVVRATAADCHMHILQYV